MVLTTVLRRWATLAAVAFAPLSAPGQELPDDPNADVPAEIAQSAPLREAARTLLSSVRKLGDWNVQYEYLADSIERVYSRNQWDSEPDVFSLDVFREVGRIPPWRMQERLDALTELVGDRYLLDEGQKATLQSLMMREALDGLRANSAQVLKYAPEALQARAAGEPYTPEQVARWSKLAEPVFLDMRKRFERASREFMDELEPDQRELVQADLDAATRRLDDVQRLSREWAEGKWKAEDWGLEEDPIQNPGPAGAAPIDAAGAGSRPVAPTRDGAATAGEAPGPAGDVAPSAPDSAEEPRPRPDRVVEADDAWARYVRDFITRYRLDEEQRQRAWLYYEDAKRRAGVIAKHHPLPATAPAAGLRSKRETDLERLFESLKRRLEMLPTRAQRRAAQAHSQPARSPN